MKSRRFNPFSLTLVKWVTVASLGLASTLVVGVDSASGATAATLTLSATPRPTVAQQTTLTASASTPGSFAFTVNGASIGCDTVATTGATTPYPASCPWTPAAGGNATIVAAFTPTDQINFTNSSTQLTVNVEANQSPLSVTSTSGTFGTPLTLTISGGSGSGAVSYTVTDGSASGCAVSGNSLTSASAGTCSVIATKADDGTYYATSSPATSVTLAEANQSALSVTSTSGTFGTPLTLTTSGGSGSGAVSYTVTDGSASGCAVSGNSLTATSAGTCSVIATKATDGNYFATSSPATSVTLAEANQSPLSVTSTSGTFGMRLTLTTGGGSGSGAVSYTVTDGSASGCAVSGNSLTSASAGTCSVTATKANDGNYFATSSPATPVNLAKATQSALSVTSTSGTFGMRLTLTTSGGSGGGAVTYTAANGSASGCAVSGNSLTSASAGTCSVTATKAGDGNYVSASSAAAAITFFQATQAPLSIVTTSGVYGTTLFLSTSGGSGSGPVSYSLTSGGTASGCQLSGNSLISTSVGTCLVTANKASDTNYLATSSPVTSVAFARAAQAPLKINPATGSYARPIALSTTGGSGRGAVTYVASNGSATGCSISGNLLISSSAGSCVVTATKAADLPNYAMVSSPPTVFTFDEAVQSSLTLVSTTGTWGTPITLLTSGGSGVGAVSFVASNGSAKGCKITQSKLRSTSAGTCVVTATKASDGNYLAVTAAATPVNFKKAPQKRLTLVPGSAPFGRAITLRSKGGSGAGAIAYFVRRGTAAGCHVSGNKLTARSTGTCIVRGIKRTDSNYLSTSTKGVKFTFTEATASELFVTTLSGSFGSPLQLGTTGGGGTGAISFAVNSGTASRCQVAGAILRAESAGTCLVRALKAGDGRYRSVASPLTTITFKRIAQAPLALTSTRGTFHTAIPLAATGGSGSGPVTFQVTGLTAAGCAIVGGANLLALTSKTAGTCLVKVEKAGDRNHQSEISPPIPVVIARAPQTPLIIATHQGVAGQPLTLKVQGGSGSGRLFFSVPSKVAQRCRLKGAVLVARGGVCRVTAVKEGDRDYMATRSSTQVINFFALKQAAIIIFPATTKAGSGISLVVRGGSGHGAVRFALRGGTSRTCALHGSTLVSQTVGTCKVVATKAGGGVFGSVQSSVVAFVFSPKALRISLSVSPSVGVKIGERVKVTASGFAPRERVVIAQCTVNATNLAMCDHLNEQSAVTSAAGVLPATAIALATGQIGRGSCGTFSGDLAACEIYVSGLSVKGVAMVQLHFAPVLDRRTLHVSPSTNLRNGEIVTLSGFGFAPNQRVYYAECLTGPVTETRCDLATYRSVVTSPSGVFPTTKIRLKAGRIGPSECGTSLSDLAACDISVANSQLGDVVIVKLTFAKP